MLYRTITSAALLAALPLTLAQTFTDCDPRKATCPADKGLSQSTFASDFTSGSTTGWTPLSGSSIKTGSNGAEFTITADGQSPTIESDFYIFFGKVEVVAKASTGIGIVSSIVLESDDLDEIDWEFLGGDTTQAQSNFFGKGDTTTYDRGAFHLVSSPQTTFHTYTVDWTKDQIQWLIDGAVVRTLPYSSPLAKAGANYPQTPMRVKIGSWVAGGANSAPGTVQWAGGKTDFSQAPFIMYVKSVAVTNYNPAESYTYGDQTGSYGSIKLSGASSGSVSAAPVVSSASSTTTSVKSAAPTSTTSSIAVLTSITAVVPDKPVSSVAVSTVITYTTSTMPHSTSAVSGLPASSGMVTSSRTSSAVSATSSGPARMTGGAVAVGVSTAGSLVGLAAALLMI